MKSSRLPALRRKMDEAGLDAVLVSQPHNRRYLSGFHGSAGFLLITEDRAVLATDFRYTEQAREQAAGWEIFRIEGGLPKWLPALLDGLKISKLGFEEEHVTYGFYRQLSDILKKLQPPVKPVPVRNMVSSLRAVKDEEEIPNITAAAAISDRAFAHLENSLRPGMTEKAAAWELERFMRDNGSQTLPFDIIVASGPNAALPHARPTDREIREGEPVVIDIGAKVGGYGSDLSRTVCLGAPDEKFRQVYDIVLGAQLAALAMIEEDMTGDKADSLARTVIREAGYADAFGHSLGHGVGLEEHEGPRLGPGSDDIIKTGMVFTVEPGIYLPGWGGVRIEDLASLEAGKVKVISQARKV